MPSNRPREGEEKNTNALVRLLRSNEKLAKVLEKVSKGFTTVSQSRVGSGAAKITKAVGGTARSALFGRGVVSGLGQVAIRAGEGSDVRNLRAGGLTGTIAGAAASGTAQIGTMGLRLGVASLRQAGQALATSTDRRLTQGQKTKAFLEQAVGAATFGAGTPVLQAAFNMSGIQAAANIEGRVVGGVNAAVQNALSQGLETSDAEIDKLVKFQRQYETKSEAASERVAERASRGSELTSLMRSKAEELSAGKLLAQAENPEAVLRPVIKGATKLTVAFSELFDIVNRMSVKIGALGI